MCPGTHIPLQHAGGWEQGWIHVFEELAWESGQQVPTWVAWEHPAGSAFTSMGAAPPPGVQPHPPAHCLPHPTRAILLGGIFSHVHLGARFFIMLASDTIPRWGCILAWFASGVGSAPKNESGRNCQLRSHRKFRKNAHRRAS